MRIVNPFYALLLVVGVAFALTGCAYTVMSFRQLDPHAVDEPGMVALMKDHGLTIMLSELGVLGLLTFAAIGTDDFWTKRVEK
jgi:hypothetical protein